MNQQPQPQAQTPSPKSGGNKTLIIVIIAIIAALIIFGIGGFFTWKYFIKAKTTTSADETTTKTTGSKLSLKTLEATFAYPSGTITKTEHPTNLGDLASELVIETPDKVQKIYDYYLTLATQKKLTVSKKSLETDTTRGSLTLQGTGYYAEIYLYQYDTNSEIDISIYGENNNITNDTANTTTSTTATPSTSTSTAANASTDSTKKTISTDYVISDSNSRVITTSELTSLTPWELKVARNEIYARHGREFVHKDLQCYFAGKSWYEKDPNFTESSLTTTENKNVATIQAYELKINSPLSSKDTGC